MATPTIPNGEEYFFPVIYEGNGAGQRVGKFVPFTDNGTIANSVIFNDGDSPKLAITPSSNGNRRTWTFSAWIKRGVFGQKAFFSWDNTAPGGGGGGDFRFDSSHRLQLVAGGATSMYLISNRTFEDTSKYYHIYIKVDTTQSTASDRVEIYVDGDKITSFSTSTYPSQNKDFNINNTSYETRFGALNDNGSLTSYFDGYLAEVNFVDGSNPAVSTFGVTDTSTGRWVPKALTGITYGTNGFRLKFQDSSALGDDTSGNTNDFTATNLATTDQTTDSPTQNHCIMDPNDETGSITMSEGNLKITQGGAGDAIRGSLAPTSGKYYFEITATATGADGNSAVGIQQKNVPIDSSTSLATVNSETFIYRDDGYIVNGGQSASGYTNWTQGNVIGIAMDLDNHKLYFSVNGTYINSGNPANGTGSVFNLVQNTRYAPYVVFQGSSGFVFDVNTGQRAFNTSAPTGFVALQQDNLPETAKGISGLVWMKNRDAADNHQWYDSSRGNTAVITSVGTPAETTVIDGLQKFLAGGQQIEDNDAINTAGESFVSWNWVGNGATEVTNTEGSVTTTVQANTTAGFSILKFTPPTSGITDQTFGHGLTKAPEWFLFKRRDNVSTGRFLCFHKSAYDASNGGYSMEISSTNANTAFNTELGASAAYPAAPTATTISIKNNSVIAGGKNHIAYCWHSVEGFSKFGSYIGNGSTDGTFVYTGFRPAWVMYKNITTASQWVIMDTKRSAFNPVGLNLLANATSVEDDGGTSQRKMDILSNGFKLRVGNYTDTNKSANTYIYMAFALHPFVGDGTSPVTAR